VQDAHPGGGEVLHGAPMRLGEQFQIPLTREGGGVGGGAGGQALSLVATVVRCNQLDEGLYSIGFQFNSSAAAVDAGSRQLTGQTPERGA
jgi:hypothetical protein